MMLQVFRSIFKCHRCKKSSEDELKAMIPALFHTKTSGFLTVACAGIQLLRFEQRKSAGCLE